MSVLLYACKDIGLTVSTGRTKYIEIARHRDMMGNQHVTVGIKLY